MHVGYGVFSGDLTNPSKISKTWTSLIPHHSLRIRLALYKIDSWPTCTFFLQADAVTVKTLTFSSLNPGTSDTCGTPSPITDSVNLNYNEAVEYLDVTVAHSSPSLQLTMVSNLATTSGSWGIRELNLTMEACDESCLTCTNDSTPSLIKAACSSCDSANGMVFSNPFCACTAGIRQKNKPCASYPCVSCPAACTAGQYCLLDLVTSRRSLWSASLATLAAVRALPLPTRCRAAAAVLPWGISECPPAPPATRAAEPALLALPPTARAASISISSFQPTVVA